MNIFGCKCKCEREHLDTWGTFLWNQLKELESKIMATFETNAADTAAAFTAVTGFISDVSTEVSTLAGQIADLKSQLSTAGTLTPDQQALLDAADAGAQSISASVADADAKLKATS